MGYKHCNCGKRVDTHESSKLEYETGICDECRYIIKEFLEKEKNRKDVDSRYGSMCRKCECWNWGDEIIQQLLDKLNGKDTNDYQDEELEVGA